MKSHSYLKLASINVTVNTNQLYIYIFCFDENNKFRSNYDLSCGDILNMHVISRVYVY